MSGPLEPGNGAGKVEGAGAAPPASPASPAGEAAPGSARPAAEAPHAPSAFPLEDTPPPGTAPRSAAVPVSVPVPVSAAAPPPAGLVPGPAREPELFAGQDEMVRKAAAENFPVALKFLPRTVREDLGAFYTYARFVDDLGDEYPGDRIAALKEVDADLARLAAGVTPRLEPVRGLRRLTSGGRVPVDPFHDLVAANLMDQHKRRYATFAELVSYCKLSANPVGRVVLYLAGQATEANIADSDAVCTGLQVIEHLQDVREDYLAGRIYLPREDLIAFGVTESDLRADHADEDLKSLLRWQGGRAAVLLSRGIPLTRRLRGWARPAVTGYVAGGRATLSALRAAQFDVLASTPKPTTSATVRAAAGVVLGRRR